MTEEVFRRDGYAFEFEAKVISVNGNEIELDLTAFYPGGGGQVCDTGTIMGFEVTEVFYKGNKIIHKIKSGELKVGDTVWCSVDWDRRYDLMMGHTGEHLLFSSLRKQVPELTINKIFISPESKYVIVDRDISWEDINKALIFANRAIRDNLLVTKTIMGADDPELERVRIKKERIPEGEDVSVVSIGDIDLSACSGLHVMETGELEMLFVDRKVSAGKDGVAIHFKVGNEAKDSAMSLANVCLQSSEAADSKPEDLVRAVSNLKNESESLRRSAGSFVKKQIMSLPPTSINGTDVIGGIFPAVERSVLSDAAEAYKSSGKVCVIVSAGSSVSVILSSGTKRVDCKDVLSKVLSEFGGRGGGTTGFAQGGVADAALAESIFQKLMERIASLLN
ncbi:alanine--tRNA ligase [Candidatus Methanoplasma termitum]|uniref:AlaS1 protein n=1 Tax=Candidatus Methanoplasma termitum TaxID=1577791 RepID=A0A0A7LAC5_9ARCH|nr:alanyl-tRNA editing protein [Candidatus Methanoplasma termitum]AIZ55973.1 alanine--tRNA ligase [Candidatus Methanoplasma termitum]MCL2334415.1 alanine--tRNA ligase-related protein [Candidatus Methanoplasma sp.]